MSDYALLCPVQQHGLRTIELRSITEGNKCDLMLYTNGSTGDFVLCVCYGTLNCPKSISLAFISNELPGRTCTWQKVHARKD